MKITSRRMIEHHNINRALPLKKGNMTDSITEKRHTKKIRTCIFMFRKAIRLVLGWKLQDVRKRKMSQSRSLD